MSYLPLSLSSTLVNIPPEVAERMLLLADHESMYQLVQLSPIFYNIFNTDDFWRKRLQIWFSDYSPNQDVKISDFIKEITESGGVELGSEEFLSMEDFLKRALRAGRTDIVALYVSRSNKEILREEARKIYDETLEFLSRS